MSMMDLQTALGGGQPPSIEVPPPEEEAAGGGSSIDFLDAAEDALNQFIQVDPDEVDRAKASQALKIVLDLKAANQQDQQQGGMKSLQRALGGGGPAAGPMAGPPAGGPLA